MKTTRECIEKARNTVEIISAALEGYGARSGLDKGEVSALLMMCTDLSDSIDELGSHIVY
ncbi:hypothetical protein GCM10011369_23520 [Neiella marina]|uniref:Uncharacterized protein n=1 Tax=Neiella marina TaxID=508461 RepID=A0A8J2U5U6_9GAMM|nr:hypothetical protein [Neiella marina]GGA80860.1 hypothetical protein GCM10011369_23520 [Neiella marina]